MDTKEIEKSGAAAKSQHGDENSIVCFCYKLTTKDLKAAHAKYGSLKAVEEQTNVGRACTGCKVILEALFGETPETAYKEAYTPSHGTSCVKPGQRSMKGFVISDGDLESTIFSSNAIAPQLGPCDATTNYRYALFDQNGVPVYMGMQTVKTNETFIFETKGLKLPRPFIGQFAINLDRGNLGGARFNIYWSNQKGSTTTHENGNTGRPKVNLPVIVDRRLMQGPNTIYLANMNPQSVGLDVSYTVFDVDTGEEVPEVKHLGAYCSRWINASEEYFKPALERNPHGRYSIRICSAGMDRDCAPTTYFFFHNKDTGVWTSNHL